MNRVYLISNMYPSSTHPSYGIFVANFVRHVERNGLVITKKSLIVGRGGNLLLKLFKYIRFYIDIIIKMIGGNVEYTYVHQVSHNAIPIFLMLPFLRSKLILNFHGDDAYTESILDKLLLPLIKRVVRRANLVVVPSKFFVELIVANFGVDRKNIFVSPSGGVNLEVFRSTKKQDVVPGAVKIGYFGRFDERKGIECLARALPLMRNGVGSCVFVGNGNLLYKLQELNGLSFDVSYTPTLQQDELVAYFNELDVFIYPSERESLGLIGLEAMACGIPVIGSNIPGPSDYLLDGYNGFVFEVNNEYSLVEALNRFCQLSKEEVNLFKKNAMDTASKFENNTIASQLVAKIVSLNGGE